MKQLIQLLALSTSLIAAPSDKAVFATPEGAADNPDFVIQGEYKGDGVDSDGKTVPAGVQVVALGKGMFSATVFQWAPRRWLEQRHQMDLLRQT